MKMQNIETPHLAPPQIVHKCCELTVSAVSSVASNTPTSSSTSSINSKMSNSAAGKVSCQWAPATTDTFLDILLEFHREGKTNGKTVRDTAWHDVLAELTKRTKTRYSIDQIRDKHKRMKKDWSEFHQLIGLTHGSWDPQSFTIVVTPEVNDKMNGNAAFNRAQKKGLKQYDHMTILWAEGTSTGIFARSNNNAELPLEEERGIQFNRYTQHMHETSTELEEDTQDTHAMSTRSDGSTQYTNARGKRRFDIHSLSPATTSSSSKSRKMEDLQRAVMEDYLQNGDVPQQNTCKWTPAQCLADVRLLDGITPSEVVNAGEVFVDPIQREIYMDHTPIEKLFWVDKYCRKKDK